METVVAAAAVSGETLGAFLRTRRDGVTPQALGLSSYGTPRRVPGLRREELAQLAGLGLAAIIVIIICFVWLMGSLVLLAWDTPWRLHALGIAAGFWILLSLVLVLRIRSLLKSHPEPFPLSRQVLADDLRSLKEDLERERNSES